MSRVRVADYLSGRFRTHDKVGGRLMAMLGEPPGSFDVIIPWFCRDEVKWNISG